MNTNLEPEELFSLSKLDGKQSRDLLKPGLYTLDFVVRAEGQLTVGEDYEQRMSPAVPWRDLFLAALTEIPARRRETFVRSYLENSVNGPAVVRHDALGQAVQDIAAEIVGTAVQHCRGKTRLTKMNLEALSQVHIISRD